MPQETSGQARISMEGRAMMSYSVLPPKGGSLNWKILDECGDVVFAGRHQQCEEWLDLADFGGQTGLWPPERVTEVVTTRLKIFELATALLRRW
jgi:hypothetical protein